MKDFDNTYLSTPMSYEETSAMVKNREETIYQNLEYIVSQYGSDTLIVDPRFQKISHDRTTSGWDKDLTIRVWYETSLAEFSLDSAERIQRAFDDIEKRTGGNFISSSLKPEEIRIRFGASACYRYSNAYSYTQTIGVYFNEKRAAYYQPIHDSFAGLLCFDFSPNFIDLKDAFEVAKMQLEPNGLTDRIIRKINSIVSNTEKEKVKKDIKVLAPYLKLSGDAVFLNDKGPAGGLIFYDACERRTSSYVDNRGKRIFYTWRYLEVLPFPSYFKNIGGDYPFGCCTEDGKLVCAGTKSAIGEGKANTFTLINAINDNNGGIFAANIAANTIYKGYDDWFLPSKEEAEALYKFAEDYGYLWEDNDEADLTWLEDAWTSTEYDTKIAWTIGDCHSKDIPWHERKTKREIYIIRAF